MNERYREAAAEVELRAEYCRTVFGQTDRVTKSMELAADILSKLATGDWVLCEPIEGHDKLRYVPVELP